MANGDGDWVADWVVVSTAQVIKLCELLKHPPTPADLQFSRSCFFSSRSFLHLGAGLSVGISGLAAGYAIGVVGDAGVRGTAQQPR